MNRRILITGAGGQLGRALVEQLAGRWELVPCRRAELDVCDRDAVLHAIAAQRPRWIVHCAAWTQVDKAESDPAAARRLNCDAVGHVAEGAKRVGARVLHFSTDYVFDGSSGSPYREDDLPRPLNAYGASKRAGEELLLRQEVPAAILRTSWLYSEHEGNFLRTVLRLAGEWARSGRPLRVVSDQRGCPTDVHSLARQSEAVIEAEASGLFHAAGHGDVSWHGFARGILEAAGLGHVPVEAISTAQYPTAARRPPYSALENRALRASGLERMASWQDGVVEVLQRWRKLAGQ